jgi:hypothetical protein
MSSSEQVWWYRRGEQRHGPHDMAEIKALAARGELQAGDALWKQGMAQWIPAAAVKGLFAAAPAAPSAPPAAAPAVVPTQTPQKPRLLVPPQAAAPRPQPLLPPGFIMPEHTRRRGKIGEGSPWMLPLAAGMVALLAAGMLRGCAHSSAMARPHAQLPASSPQAPDAAPPGS